MSSPPSKAKISAIEALSVGDDSPASSSTNGHADDRTSPGPIESLFREHYPHLRGYGRRLTDDMQLVEDAIQDVFLALCQRSSDAAALRNPRSYLLTSLRRRILDRLEAADRRRSRNEHYVVDEPTFAVSPADVDAAHDVVAHRRDALADALDTLSDRRREALYLRFYHGLRYREVADVMDIRSQSARNYVSEALNHLRDALDT
ncbi:RNA polymerase sigma factor [Longibacter sp.]|uniref:RNA polymerase sigma factor n=1 Tax=Longibacter sp. TaxID=2045415 RepID=UPI003EB96860